MKIRSAFLTALFLLFVSPLMAAGTYAFSTPTLTITDGTEGTPANFADAYLADVSGGWGAINEVIPGAVYIILANIEFGDGSTPSWFTSLNQMIYFEDGFSITITANAILQMGALVGDWGVMGSRWSYNEIFVNDGHWLNYAGLLEQRGNFPTQAHSCDFRNVIISGILGGGVDNIAVNSQSNFRNVYINKGKGLVVDTGSPPVMDGVHLHNAHTGIWSRSVSSVFTGLRISASLARDLRTTGIVTLEVRNLLGSIGVVQNTTAGLSEIISAQLVSIHINDKTGASLQGATVTATSFGNIVSDDGGSTFYRCILDHTASGTFATDVSAGKWELTTAANAALAGVTGAVQKGAWITGIDYTAAAEVLSETTDSNGNIPETVITYHKWIGLSEALLSFSPHTFTATKAREGTVEILNVTVDSPIDWIIQLSIGDKWPYRGKKVGY